MNTQAQIFRQLHEGSTPLLLANAWDAGTARLIESLGAPAIATTSAGVAWSLGYQDGGKVPVHKLAKLVKSILEVVKVPVSVDIEDGYHCDPEVVGENIKPLLDLGIAGINIEDGNASPLILQGKIERIREIAGARSVDLFINVRTDVFLQQLVGEEKRVEATIDRGNHYKACGADGLFVPAVVKPADIEQIAKGVDLPLNVLAWPGLPPAPELAKLGVRRLSAGSGIPQAVYGLVERLGADFLANGRSEPFSEGYMDHSRLQALFKRD